ncbi:hypothetical protein BJ508DRAFT_308233 [Ascobolus immersus RN42]|uniref:Uncharacterized protein n=1 Tax=Ascobolus immersus RN42 TaxID=1160509 RepID=A0A3N4I4J8_ASCIM|nr:hypothetical protein BJ508DRAFT_308233 [Ascobolus immersus RN42]
MATRTTATLSPVQTIIPLTTTYAAPESCFSTPSSLTEADDGFTYWQYDPSTFTGASTSCYPPRFRLGLMQVYSPGVCPQDYTVRRTVTVEGEYQGLCCQRDWTSALPMYPDWCFRTVSGAEIWAPGISIRWRDSDSLYSNSISATTTKSNSPTHKVSETSTNNTRESSGFDGKTIGAAVGGTVAAIALIGVASWYVFSRKKRHHHTPENPAELPEHGFYGKAPAKHAETKVVERHEMGFRTLKYARTYEAKILMYGHTSRHRLSHLAPRDSWNQHCNSMGSSRGEIQSQLPGGRANDVLNSSSDRRSRYFVIRISHINSAISKATSRVTLTSNDDRPYLLLRACPQIRYY